MARAARRFVHNAIVGRWRRRAELVHVAHQVRVAEHPAGLGRLPARRIGAHRVLGFLDRGAGATEAAKAAATAAIADMKNKVPIYVGPLKDNKTGKIVIDKTYGNLDPYLDQMNYLLEGVVGSIT